MAKAKKKKPKKKISKEISKKLILKYKKDEFAKAPGYAYEEDAGYH